MRKSLRSFRLAAVVLALASCTHVQSEPTATRPLAPSVAGTSRAGLATPSARAAETDEFNRKLLGQVSPGTPDGDLPLGAGDLIEVSVFDVQELSGLKLRLPLGGNVRLPLIGDIPAAGLTPTELQNVIRVRLQ